MGQYIDKSVLVTELEKRINELYDFLPDASKVENGIITISEACNTGKYTALESFRNYIDTLEVKEVDLREEIDVYFQKNKNGYNGLLICKKEDFSVIAKHFFELGLRSSITEEDCKLIWNIGDEIPNMPEEEFFKELLKRYKTQKGK